MDSGLFTSNRGKLQSWLRYYEDLGIRAFYRDRPPRQASMDETVTGIQEEETAEVATAKAAPPAQSRAAVPKLHLMGRGPSLFEAAERVEGDSLERICGELAGCTRCKLHRRRTNIVFGVGNPHADLVFVGEGPGHDEDLQGIPFVGRAGQLLTQMINAMGLSRDDVYIANVVKCRPPENRTPEKDEIATCLPFLFRQLTNINPKVIVCLGSVAAQALLNTNKAISHFRGQWLDFRGAKLMATYHPAYLLRNPHAKPEVWADLKKVMAFLGLTPPKGKRA
jgi:uracil-DNA glycosylase family 4